MRDIDGFLETVVITSGDINSSAFYNCSSLTSVVIGDSVSSIASNISSKNDNFSVELNSISSINFDGVWSGPAHDNLTSNLSDAVSNVKSGFSANARYASKSSYGFTQREIASIFLMSVSAYVV